MPPDCRGRYVQALTDLRTRQLGPHVAYPTSNLQIEVYDPSSGRARQLVTSGQIAPVR